MKKIIEITGLLIILLATSAFPQNGSTLGLGGATAVSRGVESVYWNPANLAMDNNGMPDFQIVLFAVTAGAGNNAFDFNFIKQYIGDGESIFLTEDDKNDILSKIDDEGLKLDVMGNVSALSWSYKNFGFGIEAKCYGDMLIPKDIYQNLLFKIGQESYDYSIDGGGYAYAKYKLSYGRVLFEDVDLFGDTSIKALSAGISAAYLRGIGYANIEKGTASLDIDNNGLIPKVDVLSKNATGGSGFGLDLGLSATTENKLHFGLVLENILGTINWDKNTEQAIATVDFGDDPLFLFGDGQLSDIDIDSVSTDTTLAIDAFSESLPLNFRMGLAKEFGRYMLNVEIANEDETFGYALGSRIKTGFVNWHLSIGRVRNTMNYGAAFALNFRHFYFDLGAYAREGLTLSSAKAVTYGSSIRFGF